MKVRTLSLTKAAPRFTMSLRKDGARNTLSLFASPHARALVTAWRDAPAWESPNEGWPMGAFAGALGISLGGPRAYGGVVAQKPFLGRGPAPEPGDLDRGLELYWRAFFVATLGALALGGLGL